MEGEEEIEARRYTPFKKSKRLTRSPTKNRDDPSEFKDMMMEFMKEIKTIRLDQKGEKKHSY